MNGTDEEKMKWTKQIPRLFMAGLKATTSPSPGIASRMTKMNQRRVECNGSLAATQRVSSVAATRHPFKARDLKKRITTTLTTIAAAARKTTNINRHKAQTRLLKEGELVSTTPTTTKQRTNK